ncbi:MAG: thioredoxin family protein [Alloprevotella sp.]|nr:thioredoxin family protein [Alloprevotella sp.]MBR1652120.1 thioredoxin family protein [Alloprevotella sp.]
MKKTSLKDTGKRLCPTLLLAFASLAAACGTDVAKHRNQEETNQEETNIQQQTTKNNKTMEHIINDTNAQEIISQNPLCVIDFSATWCGPCQKIAPVISELAAEYDGRIAVCKCDVDEAEELSGRFGVRNIPYVVFLKNGEIVDKVVGAAAKSVFVEKCEALLTK